MMNRAPHASGKLTHITLTHFVYARRDMSCLLFTDDREQGFDDDIEPLAPL
jgi:hypothetical protein